MFVSGRAAEDIVGGNATLAIRRTGQWNQCPLTCHAITHLNRIAHGPDMWVAGLEMFIDPDAAQLADLQPGILRQIHFRFDTQPQHD